MTASDYQAFNAGTMAQTALPYLTTDDREFLISGSTPEEWESLFNV